MLPLKVHCKQAAASFVGRLFLSGNGLKGMFAWICPVHSEAAGNTPGAVRNLEEMMANIKEIQALTDAFGPSGFEDEVVREVKNWCHGLDVRNDAMYNVYASMKKKKEGRPVLMLDAHLDECGFMVQSIMENGLLSILMLGGFHLTSLPAHSVIVRTREGKKHRGITTSKAVHFLTPAQKNDNSLAIEDILVDVGAGSRKEVMEVYKIRPGDPIMPDVSFEYHRENGIMYGKAFDNRLGCVSIIDTMQALKDEAGGLAVEVVGAFAAQEEVGTRGAAVTAQQVQPDLAIVFEGSPADDFLFPSGIAQGVLKNGVQIRHMDNSYISNTELIRYAQEIGNRHQIKYQDAVRRGGSTDAGKISLTGKAVPVLVLGIPSRYVHSHYNFSAAEDVDAAVKMATEVIRGLDGERISQIMRRNVI